MNSVWYDEVKHKQLEEIQPLYGWKLAACWFAAGVASLLCWWGLAAGSTRLWRAIQ